MGEGDRIVAVQRGVLSSDGYVSDSACAQVSRIRGFTFPARAKLTEERWLELVELLLKTRKVLHCEEHRSSSTEEWLRVGESGVEEAESVEESPDPGIFSRGPSPTPSCLPRLR
jgi:hypothetical protein